MQTASGYSFKSLFNSSRNMIVLATTPSWDRKGSNLLTSTPSASMISFAFGSLILALGREVSLALIAKVMSAVS